MNFRGQGESYTLGSALFALLQCFIFNQNVNWNLCFNIFYEVHYNPIEVHSINKLLTSSTFYQVISFGILSLACSIKSVILLFSCQVFVYNS